MGYESSGEEDSATPIEDIIRLLRTRWNDVARIPLSLVDTGGVFKSYPLQLGDVVAQDDTRLDYKYYDPDTLVLIKDLKEAAQWPWKTWYLSLSTGKITS